MYLWPLHIHCDWNLQYIFLCIYLSLWKWILLESIKKLFLIDYLNVFIYSIAALPDDSGSFVSVGEDRSLRIWKGM